MSKINPSHAAKLARQSRILKRFCAGSISALYIRQHDEEGDTMRQIAKRWRVGLSTLREWLREAGVKIERHKEIYLRGPDRRDCLLRKLHKMGYPSFGAYAATVAHKMTTRQVARALRVNPTTVWQYIRKEELHGLFTGWTPARRKAASERMSANRKSGVIPTCGKHWKTR